MAKCAGTSSDGPVHRAARRTSSTRRPLVPVRPRTRPSSSSAAARGSRLPATDRAPLSGRSRQVRAMDEVAPLCVVGDRILTELVDVTDDLGALDSTGLWALVLPYSGRAVCRALRPQSTRPHMAGASVARAHGRFVAVEPRSRRILRRRAAHPPRNRARRRVPGQPHAPPLGAAARRPRRNHHRRRGVGRRTRDRQPGAVSARSFDCRDTACTSRQRRPSDI